MFALPDGFTEDKHNDYQGLMEIYAAGKSIDVRGTSGDAAAMMGYGGRLTVRVPHGDDLDRALHAAAQIRYQFPVDGLKESLRYLADKTGSDSAQHVYEALQSARTMMYGQFHFPHRTLGAKALQHGTAWRKQQGIAAGNSMESAAAAVWMTAVGADPSEATSNPHYLDVVTRYANDIRRSAVTQDFSTFYDMLTTLVAEFDIPPSEPQGPEPQRTPEPPDDNGEAINTPGGSTPQQSDDSGPDESPDTSDASDAAPSDSDAPSDDSDADGDADGDQPDTEPGDRPTSQPDSSPEPEPIPSEEQREQAVQDSKRDIGKKLSQAETNAIKRGSSATAGRQTNNSYHGTIRDHEITVTKVATEPTKMLHQAQLLARDNKGGSNTSGFTTSGSPTSKVWQLSIGNTKVWHGQPPAPGKVAVLVDMSASMGCWCGECINSSQSSYMERHYDIRKPTSGVIAMQIAAVIAESNDDILISGFAGSQDIIVFDPGYQPICRHQQDVRSATPTCVGLEWMRHQVGNDADGATIILITDGSPSTCSGGHGAVDHTRQLAEEIYQSGTKFACILVNTPSQGVIDMYPSPITAVVNTMDDLRNVQVILDSLK